MINDLKELGLEYYEAKIIDELLKNNYTIRELSKKTGVPFGKIYTIVKKLKEKGILNENNSRPKLIMINEPEKILRELIDKKEKKDKEIFNRIKDEITVLKKEKGSKFFEIGTSIEDNKNIQLRSFLEAEEEVLMILNIYHKPKSNRESKTLWENEIEKAIKRGILFKAIYPVETKLPQKILEINKKYPNKFQIKRYDNYLPRIDIIDRKKVMIKIVWNDPILFGGILFIENEKLAKNIIKIFDEIWNK